MPFKENAKALQEKLNEDAALWDSIDARAAKVKADGGDESAVDKAAEPTADEKAKFQSLKTEIEELDKKCADSREYEESRKANEDRRKALNTPSGRPDFGNLNADPRNRNEAKSIGQQFVESKDWQDYLKHIAPSGAIPESLQGINSPAFEAKTLLTGLSLTRDTGGSGVVRPDYQGIVPFPLRPLSLRDVVTVGRTGSDLVEFTQITSFTNAAAPTAEATTGALDSSSGLKPESAILTALVKESVRTIAHWIPVTRRAMMDAPQMMTYIDNFLMQGLELVIEDQMIIGDGTGENFLGLDNTPNITLQPFDTDILTTARKARTKARTVGRSVATAYLMHPEDWEAFDLLTNNTQGDFYFGGPTVMGNPRLWGLPVIESEAVLKGTFYTGDLKQAVLWDRERANVRTSDSPNNYFLRNIVAVLAEARAAFGVLRPPAIVRGDLHAGANS